ncbi:MAG TPA: 3-deoxy-7-phosphoheptulonate synthase [Pyrinomonadaceae bacterium]|jgi:3-deoxy-7-phosphoheptulonate synthase
MKPPPPPTHKLSSLDFKPEKTVVRVGDQEIGNGDLTVIAGPCAVESREQLTSIAARVSGLGLKFFRGGAYKPRTSPYSFMGLGKEGLELLAEVRDKFGLYVVTEVTSVECVGLVEQYADVLQVGARNMQNYDLLRRVGRARKPVLLKRGMTATLEEFLLAAEYILYEGNPDVILCERGIRTFSDHSRFTLDLAIVPALQQISHLPVIVDPSHAAGSAEKVIPLARASVGAGADGLIVEVHHRPEQAFSDGHQALTPDLLDVMYQQVQQIFAVTRQGGAVLAAG